MSTIIQRAFASGEISPALYARVDFFRYQSGLRTCRNFFVMRHGGATNRPGTEFVGEAKDSSKAIRLYEFIFSDTQAFVLEFGDQYIRIIEDGSYLKEAAQNITGITQANPAVVTIAGHGYSNGDEVFIDGVSGMLEINNRNYKVANVTLNTFELQELDGTNIDSTSFGVYSSGGTAEKVYEVSTSYVEADLFDLQFAQSADVLTIAHPSYAPAELQRVAALNWTLTVLTYEPSIDPPSTGLGTSGTPPFGTNNYEYKITSVAEETYEESLLSATSIVVTNVDEPTATTPVVLIWDTVTGAAEYNIYREVNGIWAFVGIAGPRPSNPLQGRFNDIGLTPDSTQSAPANRDPFPSAGNYPSSVAYYQQRLTFARTTNDVEKVWASRTGFFKNFSVRSPLQDDDSVTFTLAGRRVNEIRHLVDLNTLVILTSSGEWTLEGNENGVLTPSTLNLRQQSYNGSSKIAPVIVGKSLLYVQARGTIIRDLGYNVQSDGYQGNDLTIFSNHLFDDHNLIEITYQQVPHSIVWAVRDDGVLLGLTYVREQQMLAWSRHDFDGGFVESVATIPEGNEDILYIVIRRTVDGKTKRYIERMTTRNLDPDAVEDIRFMDSNLTYNGRNTTATTMTLSGGTNWTYDEDLTLTASAAFFDVATDVGNEIHLEVGDEVIRCEIKSVGSTTVATVRANRTVPVAFRNVALTSWSKAVDEIYGLWHLEGKDVSIFGDGFVVASPYNDAYVTVTVSNGSITLDKPYAVVHIGLPYISDMYSLDIDSAQSETLIDKNKQSKHIAMYVEETRGLFVGPEPPTDDTTDALEGLVEFKLRNDEGYDEPTDLQTGIIEVNMTAKWNDNGRIFVRQVDPVPASVLAIAPSGYYPFRGGG